ncbi:ENTPD5, partial [Cordylochernes scorpioides]
MAAVGKIRDQDKSVAALDLGGGSTQVTLIPNSPQTFSKAPPTFLTFRRYLDIFSTMYTHSYLGLGLMASRHSILSYSSSPQISELPYSHWDDHLAHPGAFYSLHQPDSPSTESLHPPGSPGDLDLWLASVSPLCQDLASIHVANFKVNQPVELKSKDIVAVSYYYDRAVDLRLI